MQINEDFEFFQNRYTNPLLEGLPNNYTFAKALTEHVVLNERDNIPTAIVRPSIVFPSCEEPKAGWVDSFNGPVGIARAGILSPMNAFNLNYQFLQKLRIIAENFYIFSINTYLQIYFCKNFKNRFVTCI